VVGLFLVTLFGDAAESAGGVLHDQQFYGAEGPVAECDGADDVVGDDATAVAENVDLARLQSEDLGHVDTSVHTGQYADVLGGRGDGGVGDLGQWRVDRKSTRLNSSHVSISYAVFSWQ